ncbi:hypothetical protein BpHYR1_010649 [Brachionus plicatilis]|uniref:Uncharacterized protein n=1 Tax=Brachionus plicatilis TaxID=10195 RepID=A0A3M7PB61_BRAPC|nr:hypothetical protein BpHYR1_010649 [Brachionus plicatilis]
MEPKLSHVKIVYKNTVKLMTGLEEKTTFQDLIKAILVTKISEDSKKQKSSDDYVICQCVNGVEKLLNSNSRVIEEMRQIHQEMEQFGTNIQIFYLMRSKKSVDTLSKKKSPFKEDDTFTLLEKLIKNFDFYIHERQVYIELLEDYLTTLSLIDDQSQTSELKFDTEV